MKYSVISHLGFLLVLVGASCSENNGYGYPGAAGSATASDCALLRACCDTMPSSVKPSCVTTADQLLASNATTQCGTLLASYKSAGTCGSTSSTGGTTGCAGLRACCDGMADATAKQGCLSFATSSEATAQGAAVCDSMTQSYQAQGMCAASAGAGGGSGSGCSQLRDCCDGFADATSKQSCLSTAATYEALPNGATLCQSAADSYRVSGVCGGGATGGAGGGGGGSSGVSCSQLRDCCDAMTDAANKQTCLNAATSYEAMPNGATLCGSAADSYHTAGLCGGSTGGAGGGANAPACDTLRTCCEQMPETGKQSCLGSASTYASAANGNTLCQSAFDSYKQAGMCFTGTGGGGTGGSGTGGSGTGGGGTGGSPTSCSNPNDCGSPASRVCDPATATCQQEQCTLGSTCGNECGSNGCCIPQVENRLGTCYQTCTPFTSEKQCPSGLVCDSLGYSGLWGLCIHPGTAYPGQPCSGERPPSGVASVYSGCAAGASCLATQDGATHTCFQNCDYFGQNPSCSTSNQYCLVGGFCADVAVVSADPGAACPSGSEEGDYCGLIGDAARGACVKAGEELVCVELCPVGDSSFACRESGTTCQDVFDEPYAGEVGVCAP